MKSVGLLIILGLFVGCSSTPWKDTGEQGPWCAPGKRARVFYREVDCFGASNPQGQVAYVGMSGAKKQETSFWHELDEYFGKCTFINQWPEQGSVNSVPQHFSPFDLCLVSMNPTVVVGVERQNPKVSSLDSPGTKKYVFTGSTFLVDSIEVRTSIPYRPGAKIAWFSPAVDHDLHEISIEPGTVSFIGNGQITIAVDGALLMTSRK